MISKHTSPSRRFLLFTGVLFSLGFEIPHGWTQSAAPVISSVTPDLVAVGSPSTDISLKGNGFSPGAVAQLDDSSALPTSFISETELRATIPNVNLLKPGFLRITVVSNSLTSNGVGIGVYSNVSPSVTSISPNVVAVDSMFTLSVQGSNLAGSRLIFDSSGFSVVNLSGNDTVLGYVVQVGKDVSVGPHAFTVSKPSGAASSCGTQPCSIRIVDGGSWRSITIPNGSNRNPAATVLKDGRVLVSGGTTDTRAVSIFNPADESWSDVASMNIPRMGHKTLLLPSGRVLVYGGNTTGGRTSSAEIYDPIDDVWRNAGFVRNLTEPVLLTNGKVLVLPDEIYDPVLQTSTQIKGASSVPQPVPGAGALLPDGKVFVTGTALSAVAVQAAIYDPATDTDKSVSPIPAMVGGFATPLILPDAKLLIRLLYQRTNSMGQRLFLYSPSDDQYSGIPITTKGPMALLGNGLALVVGTQDTGDGRFPPVIPEASTYDPQSTLAEPATKPPAEIACGNSPCQNKIGLLFDGRVLYVGLGQLDIYSPRITSLPSPVVTSISVHDQSSSGDLTLQIDGLNFVPDSRVQCDGSPLVSTYVGSKRLFAFAPTGIASTCAFITVTTSQPSGGGTSMPLPIGSNIQPPEPTITGVNPSSGAQGATISAVITGTNLSDASVVFGGSGITANIQPGGSSSQIRISIAIAPDAAPGPHSISVTTPGGTASANGAFNVQRANVPVTPPLPISDVETGSIRSGYVVITPESGSAAPLTTVTFGIVSGGLIQSQAGMFPGPTFTDASVFVEVIPGIGRSLGVAIANPASTTNSITLTLRDNNGGTAGTLTVSLQPKQQLARFVHEFFSSDVIGAGFRGSLRMQSSSAFAVLGLRFSGIEFSTVPVMPSPSATTASAAIVLPQFALSGGWATQLGLLNTGDVPASGRVDIFDTSGSPMPVKLNGATQSTFPYSIPSGGTFVLAPRDSNGQTPF